MENLKKFNTQEEYQAWKDGDDYVYPNVCKVGDEVIYNNYPDYFWIEALEDLKIWQGRIIGSGSGDKDDPHSDYWRRDSSRMYYSKDKEIWNLFTANEPWIFVRKGEKIYFRSTYTPSTYDNVGNFYIIGKCNIGGSILSLLYGSNYLTQKSSLHSYAFNNIFTAGHLGVEYNQIINAKDLVLPDYVSHRCYAGLFKGCKDMITAPRLPAKTVTHNCYASVFYECSSLVQAPTLAALSTSGESIYASLFSGCSSLSYIKMLSTTNFGGDVTYSWSRNWVNGVSPTGTFIANSKRTDFTRGPHGIPEGWDLYLYDEDNDRYVVKFKVNGIPYEFYTDEPRDITWREFCSSEYNTNEFKVIYTSQYDGTVVKAQENYILLDGTLVNGQGKIILNTSYTIGQPT